VVVVVAASGLRCPGREVDRRSKRKLLSPRVGPHGSRSPAGRTGRDGGVGGRGGGRTRREQGEEEQQQEGKAEDKHSSCQECLGGGRDVGRPHGPSASQHMQLDGTLVANPAAWLKTVLYKKLPTCCRPDEKYEHASTRMIVNAKPFATSGRARAKPRSMIEYDKSFTQPTCYPNRALGTAQSNRMCAEVASIDYFRPTASFKDDTNIFQPADIGDPSNSSNTSIFNLNTTLASSTIAR